MKLEKHQILNDSDVKGDVNKTQEYPKIYKTFISPSKRLFVLALQYQNYNLYCVDLDKYNMFKGDTLSSLSKQKRPQSVSFDIETYDEEVVEIPFSDQPIFSYPEESVAHEEPKQIYIRDQKKSVRTGEFKRMFFFALHAHTLYSSSCFTDEEHSNHSKRMISPIDVIGNSKFFTDDQDSIFYLVKNNIDSLHDCLRQSEIDLLKSIDNKPDV